MGSIVNFDYPVVGPKVLHKHSHKSDYCCDDDWIIFVIEGGYIFLSAAEVTLHFFKYKKNSRDFSRSQNLGSLHHDGYH